MSVASSPSFPENRVTFLYTDVVDGTRANVALGNQRYRDELLKPHFERIAIAVHDAGGFIVQDAGDSKLVVFRNARKAVECAVAIQQALNSPRLRAKADDGKTYEIHIRIGLHSSREDVTPEVHPDQPPHYHYADTSYGHRVMSIANGDQILLSEEAYQASGNATGIACHAWDNRYLKSFADKPATVYEVLYDNRQRAEPGSRWLPTWYVREMNSFIGREKPLQEIREWLSESRYPLYTLLGLGGIGKTRLAVQTVLTVSSLFPGGIGFVALDRAFSGEAASASPIALAQEIARAVGAPEAVTQISTLPPLLDALIDFLNGKESLLLILDNWESVANDQTVEVLDELLCHVSSLRCLVTSQVVMNIANWGDQRTVRPLEIPTDDDSPIETLDSYKLFIERARQRERDERKLPLTDTAAIRRILKATGGFALGIELTAARAVDKTLPEIAAGLEKNLLDWQRTASEYGDRRSDVRRHDSMDACIDWSVRLLPTANQERFPRLGIFPFDFTAEAANAICEVNDAEIVRLVRASLVEKESVNGVTRYSLLPAVREYAASRIEIKEEIAAIRSTFVTYYSKLLVANEDIHVAAQRDALDAELQTLLAVAHSAFINGKWAKVMIIGSGLTSHLQLRGRWAEWETLCQLSIDAAVSSGDRQNEGAALNDLGIVCQEQGRWNDALIAYESSLTIKREFNDRIGEGMTLNNMGVAYRMQGRLDDALAAYEKSLAIKREYKDRIGEGLTLNNLGGVYRDQGRWDDALKALGEDLDICREFKDRIGEGQTLNNLGIVYRMQSRWDDALAAYENCLVIKREYKDRIGEGLALENIAILFRKQNNFSAALPYAQQSVAALAPTEAKASWEKAKRTLQSIEAQLTK